MINSLLRKNKSKLTPYEKVIALFVSDLDDTLCNFGRFIIVIAHGLFVDNDPHFISTVPIHKSYHLTVQFSSVDLPFVV